MKKELTFKDKDLLVMKLLHYFITEKEYNPIILHGIENEIWLENNDGPYRIIRIVMGYIHNNDQYEYDMFKTKRIMQKIKFKTLTFKMNVCSIFLDLGDNVELEEEKNIDGIKITKESDLFKSEHIINEYPDMKSKMVYDKKGVELFSKITEDINKKNQHDAKKAEEVLSVKKPYVTYSLILINILVFIAMYLFGSGSTDINTLINFGALSKAHILINHEYYRLFTSAFIHIGILHIALNMYALYIIGPQLESFYGHLKYSLIYLFSILFSSLISSIFISSNTISAGASGAIFGLLGALLYFGYHYRTYFGDTLIKRIIPIILLNLLIGFSFSGIDNAAHIGGLLGGILIAIGVGIKYKTSTFEKVNGLIVSLLAIIFLAYMAFFR